MMPGAAEAGRAAAPDKASGSEATDKEDLFLRCVSLSLPRVLRRGEEEEINFVAALINK